MLARGPGAPQPSPGEVGHRRGLLRGARKPLGSSRSRRMSAADEAALAQPEERAFGLGLKGS